MFLRVWRRSHFFPALAFVTGCFSRACICHRMFFPCLVPVTSFPAFDASFRLFVRLHCLLSLQCFLSRVTKCIQVFTDDPNELTQLLYNETHEMFLCYFGFCRASFLFVFIFFSITKEHIFGVIHFTAVGARFNFHKKFLVLPSIHRTAILSHFNDSFHSTLLKPHTT